MAEIIRKAVNRFTKGLIMDFSPENTKNDTLTHALNATLLTFNGNELSLQNDMGNARVETAYLPEGYIPVGTCEYGGIIYIVSYNPLEDKSQIGCFPSPERTVSSDELGISDCRIDKTIFQSFKEGGNPTGELKNTSQCVLLRNGNLNPGDKFLVNASDSIYDEAIKDMFQDDEPIAHPRIALNVVSIEDSGKIIYLNSEIRKYEVSKGEDTVYKYHLLGNLGIEDSQEDKKQDIDNYRNVLSSGYSVFKSKTSGKLALLAELIMIDSFSVTHGLVPKVIDGKVVEGRYDIILYPEITPEVTSANYLTVPKLKYYCLENSQGYLQVFDDATNKPINMFSGDPVVFNNTFLNYKLSQLYTPISPEVTFTESVGTSGKFNFPKPGTYHGQMQKVNSVEDFQYTKLSEDKFHRLTYEQINSQLAYFKNDLQVKIYRFNGKADAYSLYEAATIDPLYTYYTKKTEPVYKPATKDDINKTLFKIVNPPTIATDEIIEDTTIEKFQYREIYIYRKASEKEVEEHNKPLWKKGTDDSWTEVPTPTVGEEYYIQERKQEIVSIGWDINKDNILGSVYYYPNSKVYVEATPEEKEAFLAEEMDLYYISNENVVYEKASITEIDNYVAGESELYYNTQYILIKDTEAFNSYSSTYPLFVVSPVDVYVPKSKLVPDPAVNYIAGGNKPGDIEYPKDDPLYLYKISDFMPVKDSDETYTYQDCVLGGIKFPKEILLYNLDLPFKYDYTITPCMDYGKLNHLSVSNTVDFSKLHLFEQSNFTTWKYHIDGNQLRLTFGAEIYDTYEVDKVDGLVLEFYDLWGFAGSLEVSGKKAYSGIFTKIIPLNTLNALSKKKIIGTETLELFKRNINIKEQDDKFVFNTREVEYSSHISGWVYKDTNQPISDIDNDCGVLYSNLVYGVKTYLKMLKSDGSTAYIPKKELFLFTIPIYNEYYYTTDNFNTLENPTLDMVLTYKLEDKGSKNVYENGYNSFSDRTLVNQYLSGSYSGSDLSVVKYYEYTGITNLYLEVGLKKEYTDLYIGYSPEINSFFSCDLQLMSNEYEDKTLTIQSTLNYDETSEQLLNYKKLIGTAYVGVMPVDYELQTPASTINNYTFDINKLGFGIDYENNYEISSLDGYTFLNKTSEYSTPIPIYYKFIVGYNVNITNIKASKIPMTTFCALYHKDDYESWNDYDFGVYTIEFENNTQYYPNAIFYNSGSDTEEIFGVCQQINTEGTLEKQCQILDNITSEALLTKTPGKLNTGNPLTQLKSHIGKLTFGQPHIQGFGDAYGVNIDSDGYIKNDTTPQKDSNKNKLNPQIYNLCANTKASIDYTSEFISLIPGHSKSNDPNIIQYTGIEGKNLPRYYECLLETMKDVYVYNPDYDTFSIKMGDVSVEDKKLQFLSNLISKNAKFNFPEQTCLNDYIYIGPTDFTTYLKCLNEYSGIKVKYVLNDQLVPLKQVTFIPNYTYCGTKAEGYLISSLTYNIPIPDEIPEDLSFQSDNLFAIRKADGDIVILEGSPNKKSLYGLYYDDKASINKLINLDVSHYQIDPTGALSVGNGYTQTEQSSEFLPVSTVLNSFNNQKSYTHYGIFNGTNLTNGRYEAELSPNTSGGCYYDPWNRRVILIGKKGENDDKISFNISTNDAVTSIGTPKIKNIGIVASINTKVLSSDTYFVNGDPRQKILLEKQDVQTLHEITLSSTKNIKYKDGIASYKILSSDVFWEKENGKYVSSGLIGETYEYSVGFGAEGIVIDYSDIKEEQYIICSITISDIVASVEKIGNLSDVRTSVVEVPSTNINKYATIAYDDSNMAGTYHVSKPNVSLRYTTITLNDLTYEPNLTGHRLYLKKSNLWSSSAKLYYRELDSDSKDKGKDYNSLVLYVGPSFINTNNE